MTGPTRPENAPGADPTAAAANPPGRGWLFWAGFVVVILVIAGGVSYLASSSPDGLDSATQQGCVYDETGEEIVTGSCIAQSAKDHQLSDHTPLADYTVMGNEATVGLAGIVGVIVTVAVAGGAFWLIARSRSTKPPAGG